MSDIPTAKEIFLKHSLKKEYEIHTTTMERYEAALKEFAKLHVKAALEAASQKAKLKYSLRDDNYVKPESILESYPEHLIK